MNIDTIRDCFKLAMIKDVDAEESMLNEIQMVNPYQLLCPERFYFVIKYKYAEMIDKGEWNPFIEAVYREHLRAFSKGKYIEPGQEKTKNSFKKYQEDFEEIFTTMKNDGFDSQKSIILVNEDGLSLDGSHRIGIAMYLNIALPVLEIKQFAFNGNYEFFMKRKMHIPYLEYMIYEYCKLKRGCRVLCIWPKALSDNEKTKSLESIITKYTKILYKKEYSFTKPGLHNFLVECYRDKEWIGSIDNKYRGIDVKEKEIWSKGGKCIFYVIDQNDNNILQLKEEIRKFFNIGNSSVHGTDTDSETMKLLDIILNNNTLEVYNYFDPFGDTAFVKQMRAVRLKLDSIGIDEDSFIFDSSGILNLCNIRKAGDIDYLITDGTKDVDLNSICEAENHEDDLMYHPETKIELFTNPENYVMFEGIKYLSLDCLLRFKRKRASKKDKRDIKRILRKRNVILIKKILGVY